MNVAATIARLRASAGPSSQPTQSAASQATPINAVTGPTDRCGRSEKARPPAARSAKPAMRSAAAAPVDEAAYVVGGPIWSRGIEAETAPYASATMASVSRAGWSRPGGPE